MAAAEALKITAKDLLALRVVDEIVPEPLGGGHADIEAATRMVEAALHLNLEQVSNMSNDDRLELRYQKFRRMGDVGLRTEPTDTTVSTTGVEGQSHGQAQGQAQGQTEGQTEDAQVARGEA